MLINSSKIYDFLAVIFLILVFLLSNHIYYTKFLPQLPIFIFLGFYLVLLLIFNNKFKIITDSNIQNLLLILVLILMLGELKHFNLIKMLNWVVISLLLVFLWSIRSELIQSFLKRYLILVSIILFISIAVMYGYYLEFNIYKYFSYIFHYDIYNRTLNSSSLPILHADSWINDWQPEIKKLTVIMPRIPAHFHQGSLLSAYVLFPLGISMLFSKLNSKIIFFVFVMLLLSLTASVYIIFISSIFIYLFFNLIKKFNIFIIIIGILFIVVFSLLIREIGYQVDTNTIDLPNNHLINYFLRVGSGLYRLGILGNQVYMFFHNPLIGPIVEDYRILNEFLLGSFIFTNGIRAGILALLLTIFILFAITKRLFLVKTNSFRQKYGICVIYSCLLQMFLYQDFGYSSTNGIVLLSILILFINKQSEKNI